MPLEFPYYLNTLLIKYRHAAGTTVRLTCMLDDDDSPSSLPVINQIVWISIQKTDDDKWLDFSASTFTGTNPDTVGCQQQIGGYNDGTHQFDFNPRSYSAMGPQCFMIKYQTYYSFGPQSYTPNYELHYFYGIASGAAPSPPAHNPP